MKLPRGVTQPLEDKLKLTELPSSAFDQQNGWVFTRLLKEYVTELVTLADTSDELLVVQKAKVNYLFQTLIRLGDQLKRANLDDDDIEED
jgi:hypothetical protein